MLRTYGASIKNVAWSKLLIKKFNIDHMKKKLDVHSFEKMRKGFTEFFVDSDIKDLHHEAGKYYGMLIAI